MNTASRWACICLYLMWASVCVAQSTPRMVKDFNFGWRFMLGDDATHWAEVDFDEQGQPVPTADLMLEFSVDGQGELFGVDNGNAAETLCLKGNKMPLFSGKALAVVRSLQGKRGTALLHVKSAVGEKTMTIMVE